MGLTRLLGLLEPITSALLYLLMACCVTDITLSFYSVTAVTSWFQEVVHSPIGSHAYSAVLILSYTKHTLL